MTRSENKLYFTTHKLAPAMMPVTPEKRTPNTVKKLIGTESSSMEQSNENLSNRMWKRTNLVK